MIRKMDCFEKLFYIHNYGHGVECLRVDYPDYIAEMILAYKTDFINEEELEEALMQCGWIWDRSKERSKENSQ